MKICMITGLNKLSKFIHFKNAGGMGTQVPILADELKKKGFEVKIDVADDYDILHLHNPLPNFIPLIKNAKKKKKAVVIHARHIPELVKGGFLFGEVFYPFFEKYSKWIYNMADVVICPTPYVKKWMEKNGVKSDLVVIPNGVRCNKFSHNEEKRKKFRKRYGFSNEWIIFSVGLLIPRKGILDFMEVAKKFIDNDEMRFAWIGSTEPGLKKADISHAPKNINFLGHVPFNEMPQIYSGGDVFFFPTYAESYGNVLFEAASAGKILLIRDIEIYREWFKNGENCLKGKSVEEYAKCIKKIVEDEKLRERLHKGSLKIAKANDVEKSIEKLVELYENLYESV